MELNASPGVVAEASALELDWSPWTLAKPAVRALVLSKVAGRATIRGMIWSCTWRLIGALPRALSLCLAAATREVSVTSSIACFSGFTSLPLTRRSVDIGRRSKRSDPMQEVRARHSLAKVASGFRQRFLHLKPKMLLHGPKSRVQRAKRYRPFYTTCRRRGRISIREISAPPRPPRGKAGAERS